MRCRSLVLSTLLAGCTLPWAHPAAAADPSDTCAGTTVLSGYAGPASVVLRLDQSGGALLVCVAADDGSGFHAGGLLTVDGTTATFQPDPAGTDQPPAEPAPPVPSGTCETQPGAVRLVDMDLPAGERLWVYLAPDPAGLDDVCAGVGGPVLAFGVRITPGSSPVVAGDGSNLP